MVRRRLKRQRSEGDLTGEKCGKESVKQQRTLAERTENGDPDSLLPGTSASPIYFWRETEPEFGFMSQWFGHPFRDSNGDGSPASDRIYRTAEHYMMYHKAMLFSDPQVAAQILAASSPRAVRALGRKVRNFDEETWAAHRDRIVREGNVCKFTCAVSNDANAHVEGPALSLNLRDRLLATGTRELVEASPYDRIWGIGFTAKNAPNHRPNWGQNRLGKALMEVREMFQQQQQEQQQEQQEQQQSKMSGH